MLMLKKRENEDFKFIMARIIDAAEHGNYEITINREDPVTLTNIIRDKLEQLGYNIEVQTALGDFYRGVISWKGEEENEQ